jgi:hypothetical protein
VLAAIKIDTAAILQKHAPRAHVGQMHEALPRLLHHGVEHAHAIDRQPGTYRADRVLGLNAEHAFRRHFY